MAKPILVVTSRYTREIEDRIDRDYDARRNANEFPFSQPCCFYSVLRVALTKLRNWFERVRGSP